MIDPRLAWFAIGATCSAVLFGWPWHPRFSLRMGPPKGSYGPRQPEQPLAADLIRYSRWRSEQIERALSDEPIGLDPGRVQRGNNSGGPTTPKPAIVPKPQFPPPRVIPGDTP